MGNIIMEETTIKVEGMSCQHCVSAIEGALGKAGAEGKVDLGAGTVAVRFEPARLDLARIKSVIEDQGYDVPG